MDVGRDLDPPVRWVRAYWNEPSLIGEPAAGLDGSKMEFLYELTAEGLVLRSIELMGIDLIPVGAASLAEFWELQGYQQQPATPDLIEYGHRFGDVPEGSEADWGDYPHDEISQEDFQVAWVAARAHLIEHPRSEHFAGS